MVFLPLRGSRAEGMAEAAAIWGRRLFLPCSPLAWEKRRSGTRNNISTSSYFLRVLSQSRLHKRV